MLPTNTVSERITKLSPLLPLVWWLVERGGGSEEASSAAGTRGFSVESCAESSMGRRVFGRFSVGGLSLSLSSCQVNTDDGATIAGGAVAVDELAREGLVFPAVVCSVVVVEVVRSVVVVAAAAAIAAADGISSVGDDNCSVGDDNSMYCESW